MDLGTIWDHIFSVFSDFYPSSYFCELWVLPAESLRYSCFDGLIFHDLLTFRSLNFNVFLLFGGADLRMVIQLNVHRFGIDFGPNNSIMFPRGELIVFELKFYGFGIVCVCVFVRVCACVYVIMTFVGTDFRCFLWWAAARVVLDSNTQWLKGNFPFVRMAIQLYVHRFGIDLGSKSTQQCFREGNNFWHEFSRIWDRFGDPKYAAMFPRGDTICQQMLNKWYPKVSGRRLGGVWGDSGNRVLGPHRNRYLEPVGRTWGGLGHHFGVQSGSIIFLVFVRRWFFIIKKCVGWIWNRFGYRFFIFFWSCCRPTHFCETIALPEENLWLPCFRHLNFQDFLTFGRPEFRKLFGHRFWKDFGEVLGRVWRDFRCRGHQKSIKEWQQGDGRGGGFWWWKGDGGPIPVVGLGGGVPDLKGGAPGIWPSNIKWSQARLDASRLDFQSTSHRLKR